MRGLLTGVLAAFLALPLAAQETTEVPLDELLSDLDAGPSEEELSAVDNAPGAELRVLDKLTGQVVDVTLLNGQTAELGFLRLTMDQCRYPIDNPSGDAFVYIQTFDLREQVPLFAGWIIASSPALNAMDHPRYDVWALRCSIS